MAQTGTEKINGVSMNGSMHASSQSSVRTVTKSSTNGFTSTTSSSTTSSTKHQRDVQTVGVLREVISKATTSARRDLGSSSGVLEQTRDVEIVLDYIAAERLGRYPHPGSKYDKVLRLAEQFVSQIAAFSETVSEFVLASAEGAHLMFGSCLLLLQIGESNLAVLDKLFSTFQKLSLSLEVFAAHREVLLANPAAQLHCGKAYGSLLQIVTNTTIFYSRKITSGVAHTKSGEFEKIFGHVIESYYNELSRASLEMWSICVGESIEQIESIRNLLQPQDRVTRALLSGRISSRYHRAEYTCEWATKRLTEFIRSKDDVLLMTGKEYSGKSVLAGWIVDHIRNTKGRHGNEVISFSIDTTMKEQMSSLSVVKALVLQIFDAVLGDTALYEALKNAMRLSTDGRSAAEIEEALWSALDVATTRSRPMILVVDGLNYLGESSSGVLERIQILSSKHATVKSIVLSRPLTKSAPKNVKIWSIEHNHTKEDIVHFVRERLTSSPVLKGMQKDQKDTIVERIAASSQGSFTWSDLVIEIIQTEKSFASVSKSLDSMPKVLKDVTTRLVSTVDIFSRDAKTVLAWMIASQRPLLLTEMQQLLEIDVSSMTYSERLTSAEEDIRRACGGLVDINDGVVRFRSLAVRQQLIEMAGSVKDFSNKDQKFPFHVKEANYDLCLRLLAYFKLVVDRHMPLSTTVLTQKQLNSMFNEYNLLEYASRYWISHFQQSPLYEPTGKHKITGGIKNAFPTSVVHALVEISCLRYQYVLSEVYEIQKLALDLRKTILGDQKEVVLQNVINIATIRQQITSIKEANTFFYEAWRISNSILSETSEITVFCARSYIDSVTTFTTKSVELEEVLRYFIEYQKTTYGVADKRTLFYLRRLADYCTVIKQESTAASLYRQIYEILVAQHGSHSTETEEIYHCLKKVSTKEELQSITQEQHKSIEKNVSVTDDRRITVTRDMVQHYESENNIAKAEETMVNYWREISEASRTTKDLKTQEKQVNATFEYVEFLKRHKRGEEATAILNGLFLELQTNTSIAQSRVGWVERIAGQMKQLGAVSSAQSIYSSLWSYYRSSGQQSSAQAQSIAHELTETASSSVTSTTSMESQEQMYHEILETSTATSTTVDTTTVKTSLQLISLYTRQEKHEETIEVCRDMLQRIWPTALTGQKDVRLPNKFLTETVQIANQLAKSYFAQHYVEESSQIYSSIFQAFRSVSKQHTTELSTAARTLISHYQSIYRQAEALKIYKEYYEALVEVYGVSNHEVIGVAYEKADMELKQNRRKDAQASYEKIYTDLKGNNEYCHKDGIRAALSLCKLFEKEQKWEQAKVVYKVLWLTFLRKGQEYSLGEDFVNQIFDRYLFILEHKTTTDYKTLRNLAAEYRDACVKLYGSGSERTLTANMRLAELDEKDESHKDEAISIYESILTTHQDTKKISSASILSIISTTKQRLAYLYSISGITHDRAQALYLAEFESSKNKHTYSHPETLSWLDLLITCYRKRNTTETNHLASQTLQDVAINIILYEKDSTRLYESSKTIARIYSDQKVTTPSASDYLSELRRHVVSGESNIVQLKGKTTERRAYPFIIGFEETIRGLGASGQFSVLMSELMTESLLTESYMKAKKSNASFDSIFGYGARLRLFYRRHERKDSARLDEELLEIFTQKIVGNRETDKAAIRQFFDIVVSEHGKDQQDVIILQNVAAAVLRACNENQFQRGLSLAILSNAYVHHYDGFRSHIKVENAFKICLYLAGHGTKKCPDAKLQHSLLNFSSRLLKEVLRDAKAIQLNMVALPVDELNTLVGLLGLQKNYEDLEWLLTDLWKNRHALSCPPSTTALLGRRLIECRFIMGLRSDAFHLAEDMVYNLRRVWGPLDKTTLELTDLLAEMYTAAGRHASAIALHEDVLTWIISDERDRDDVSKEEEATIAAAHFDLLKHAYARNNGWPEDKDMSGYVELFKAVEKLVGGEQQWKTAVSQGSVQTVDKWVTMNRGFKEDGVGMWKKVEGDGDGKGWYFSFESESKRKHINAMRRVSGRFNGHKTSTENGWHSTSSTSSFTMVA